MNKEIKQPVKRILSIVLMLALLLAIIPVIGTPARAVINNTSLLTALNAKGYSSTTPVINLSGDTSVYGDVNIQELKNEYPSLQMVNLSGTNVTSVTNASVITGSGGVVNTANTLASGKSFTYTGSVIEFRESGTGDLSIADLLAQVNITNTSSAVSEPIPAGMLASGTVTIGSGTPYTLVDPVTGTISRSDIMALGAGSYLVTLSFPINYSSSALNITVRLQVKKSGCTLSPALGTVYDGGSITYTLTKTDEDGNAVVLGSVNDYDFKLYVNATHNLVYTTEMSTDNKQMQLKIKAAENPVISTSAELQVYAAGGFAAGALPLATARIVKATNPNLSSISFREYYYNGSSRVVGDSVASDNMIYISGGTSISSKTSNNVINNVYTDTTMYLLVDNNSQYISANYKSQFEITIGADIIGTYGLSAELVEVANPLGGSEQVLALVVTGTDVLGNVYTYDNSNPTTKPVLLELTNTDSTVVSAHLNATTIGSTAKGYMIYQVPKSYENYTKTEIEEAIRNNDSNIKLAAHYTIAGNVWTPVSVPGAEIVEDYTIYLVSTAYYQDGGGQFIVPSTAINGTYYAQQKPSEMYDGTPKQFDNTTIDASIDGTASFSSGSNVLKMTTGAYNPADTNEAMLVFSASGAANNVEFVVRKTAKVISNYLIAPAAYSFPGGTTTYLAALQWEIDDFVSSSGTNIGDLYRLNVLGEDDIAIGGTNTYQIIAIYNNDSESASFAATSVAGDVSLSSSVSPVPVSAAASASGNNWFNATATSDGGAADALAGSTVDMTYSDGTISSAVVKLTIGNSSITGLYQVFEDDLGNLYSSAPELYNNFSDISQLTANFQIPLGTNAKVYAVYKFNNTSFYASSMNWMDYIAGASNVTLTIGSANITDMGAAGAYTTINGAVVSTGNAVGAALTTPPATVTINGNAYQVSAGAIASDNNSADVIPPLVANIYAYTDDAGVTPSAPLPNNTALTGYVVGDTVDTDPTVTLSDSSSAALATATAGTTYTGSVMMMTAPVGSATVNGYEVSLVKDSTLTVTYEYSYTLNGVPKTVTLADGATPSSSVYEFYINTAKATAEGIYLVVKDNSSLTWHTSAKEYTLPYVVGSTFRVYPVVLDSSVSLTPSYTIPAYVTEAEVAQYGFLNYMTDSEFTFAAGAWTLTNASGKVLGTIGVDTNGYVYYEFTVTGEIFESTKLNIDLNPGSITHNLNTYSAFNAAANADATVYNLADADTAYVVDIIADEAVTGAVYYAGNNVEYVIQYALSSAAIGGTGTNNTIVDATYFNTATLTVLPGSTLYDATAANALRVEQISGPGGCVLDSNGTNLVFKPTAVGTYEYKIYTYNRAGLITPNFGAQYRTITFTVSPAQAAQTVYYAKPVAISALTGLSGAASIVETGSGSLDSAALANGVLKMLSNAGGTTTVEICDANGTAMVEVTVTMVGAARSVALSETATAANPKQMVNGASSGLAWNVTYTPTDGSSIYSVSEEITSWTQTYRDDLALALNLSGSMITAAAGTVSGIVVYDAVYDSSYTESFWANIDATAVPPAYNYVITDSATDITAAVSNLSLQPGDTTMLYVWNADTGALVSGLAFVNSDDNVVAQTSITGTNAFNINAISNGSATITAYPSAGGYVSVNVNVATAAPDVHKVIGSVTDGTNPISGAAISVSDGTNIYTGTTDGNGDFTVVNVPNGNYTVTASAPGYDNETVNAAVSNADANVGVITMTAIAAFTYNVTGTVEDDSGSPLQGVTVTLEDSTNTYTYIAVTDINGDFIIANVPDETYTIDVSYTGYVYSSGATSVTVNGDHEAVGTIEMTAITASTHDVTGNVVDDIGPNAISGAIVTLDDGTNTYTGTTDSNGDFTVTVPDEDYTITVSASGFVYLSGAQSVTVNGYDEAVGTIEMTAGNTNDVIGTVEDTNGNAISAASATLRGGTSTYTAATDINGDFTIANVPDGNYTLTVSASGYINERVPVTVNGALVDVGTITLTSSVPSTHNVTGTVIGSGGSPISGADVTVSDGTNTYTATTNSNGNFTVTGVPDGSYTVTITAGGYNTYTDTVAVSGSNASIGTITMTASGGTTTYDVTGKVKSGSKSISGATVYMSGSTNTYTATTDSNGDFTISGVPDGSYSITATKTGYYTYTANVTVSGGNLDVGTIYLTERSSGSGSTGSSSTTTYKITVDAGEGGKASANKSSASEDATITVTVTPDSGYKIDSVTAKKSGGSKLTITEKSDGVYTFTMPASDVTVTVTFVSDSAEAAEATKETEATVSAHVCPSEAYTDLNTSLWYHEYTDYVLEKGIMNGTGTNTFGPNANLTRAMMVQILYNMEDEHGTSDSAAFSDVSGSAWYANAVAWASSNGIVTGYDDNTFKPDASITREQMTAILYRYADYKGYDTSAEASLTGYEDADSIGSYAVSAVKWAVKEGIINGRDATHLAPAGTATRAEVAAIMTRFCELYK